jgi:hypothetical protein
MMATDKLEGSWNALFDAVDEHFTAGPERRRAIGNLYEAVLYLVQVCPEDNLMQTAARRAGRIVGGNVEEANGALQMMRVAAIIELMQEAQKEKSSVTAYKRARKALLTLGIDNEDAINLVMYTLEFHSDREGTPYMWLAEKLKARGK